ncbi:hypothetical protein HZA42_00935 [Candidatus Peregrinibacteria bacterium]|nr:hypothetical protein [Candidatus Peregrinibacteria bacterium]
MKSLINFYFRHKKLCTVALLAIALAAAYHAPSLAFADAAADAAKAAKEANDPGSILRSVNEIFNLILRASSALFWPVIVMIGSLLDNDLIFGGAMGEKLLAIWVQVRNLVNIAFVLILLAVAVYNVLGIGKDGEGSPLSLKQALPKFVLALVAVNFSFLAVKVVLDFTNVLTGVVFALPTTVSEQNVNLPSLVDSTICGTQSKEVPMRAIWCENNKINERARALFSRLDRSNITLAYALRFGKTIELKFVKDDLQGLSQLGFNIIFNTVLYVIFAVSFIVLFLVLLARIVVLWVAVILSPVMALGIVLPNLKELAGGTEGMQQTLVQNAIAPIKIGLVLAVGYIMLDGFQADKSIHGDLLSSSTMSAIDPNSIPTGINDLQQLMIAVAVVVILWTGVFMMAEKSSAKFITDKIRNYGESFGGWAAKLPTYAKVLPMQGKNQSIQQVLDTGRFFGEKLYESGRSPLRGTDRASTLRELGTVAQTGSEEQIKTRFGHAVTNDHGIINEEGFKKAMIDAFKKVKDPDFEKRFLAADTPKKRVDAIYESNGELAKELQAALGSRAAAEQSVSAGTEAPKPVKTETEARDAIKETGRTPQSLAGKDAFAKWTETNVKEYREAWQAAGDTFLNAVKVDVANAPNMPFINAGKIFATTVGTMTSAQVATPQFTHALRKARAAGMDNTVINGIVDHAMKDAAAKVAAKNFVK